MIKIADLNVQGFRMATTGRIERDDIVEAYAEVFGWARVELDDAPQLVVKGGRPAKKRLEKLRAADPDLIELEEPDLAALPLREVIIQALRTGAPLGPFRRLRRDYLDVAGADLRGLRIEGASLNADGADLSKATLVHCWVKGHGVCLRDARIQGQLGAELSQPDLRGLDASGAELHYSCQLTGGSWEGANLDEAKLDNVEFTAADLRGARLSIAARSRARFHDCRLDGLDLGDAARQLELRDCSAVGARMALSNYASAQGCDFTDADLRGSWLAGIRSDKNRFDGASLEGTSFLTLDLRDAQPYDGPETTAFELRCATTTPGVELSVHFSRYGEPFNMNSVELIEGSNQRRVYLDETELPALLTSTGARPDWSSLEVRAGDEPATVTWIEQLTGGEFRLTTSAEPADDREAVASLLEHRDSMNDWQVFCDWLLEHGDERGPRLVRLLRGDGSAQPYERSPSHGPKGLDYERRLLFFRSVELGRACPKYRLMEFLEDPDSRLLDEVRLPNVPPACSRFVLEQAPVRVVHFAGRYEPALRKLKSPARRVEAIELGSPGSPLPVALLRHVFPKLTAMARARVEPQALTELGITMLEYAGWHHDDLAAQRAAVTEACAVPSLRELAVYFDLSAELVELAASHHVSLTNARKTGLNARYRWASR